MTKISSLGGCANAVNMLFVHPYESVDKLRKALRPYVYHSHSHGSANHSAEEMAPPCCSVPNGIVKSCLALYPVIVALLLEVMQFCLLNIWLGLGSIKLLRLLRMILGFLQWQRLFELQDIDDGNLNA